METLNDYHFWLSILFFFPIIFISFFIPGFLFLKKLSLKNNGILFLLAWVFGYVIWTAQGYIFGYLHIRWMTYLYVAIMVFFGLRNIAHISSMYRQIWKLFLRNKLPLILIFIGMILQNLHMFGSGLIYEKGMYFLGSNGVDGVMHLGYIQELAQHFPPFEPGAYQLRLQNYHYWLDLSIAELVRIWKISPLMLFFQCMPLFFSFMTGVATFLVMRLWTGSKIAGVWALFFLYFAGDGAFLFMLALQHTFGFHTPAIDNGITQYLNMPHGAAKMVFTTSLVTLYYWIKTQSKQWGIVMVILFASLIGFKIYYGIFVGLGLLFVIIYKIVISIFRQNANKVIFDAFSLVLFLLFVVFASIIFFPPNAGAGGLGWYPLEWPKVFLGPDNLNIREWWLRMQVYESTQNIKYIVLFDLFAIIVGLICIQGTRLLGLFPSKTLAKQLGTEHLLFFIPTMVLFHFLGLFTLQKAGSFNVFNFFVVASVVMSIFLASIVYALQKKKVLWASLLLIFIVGLTIPRSIYEIIAVSQAITKQSGFLLPKDELEALSYLHNNLPKDVIIQSHPKNVYDTQTTYLAYFTNSKTYLSGITMIESHGQPIQSMQSDIKKLFDGTSASLFSEGLKKHNINYIYLQKTKDQEMLFVQNGDLFKKIFENSSVIVYKVI